MDPATRKPNIKFGFDNMAGVDEGDPEFEEVESVVGARPN